MIFYKSQDEIGCMRHSGLIVASVLEHLRENIKAGISTLDVEEMALQYLNGHYDDIKPAFLGYMGFPASICVSINDEIVHGIPSKTRFIKKGDIVSVDFGVVYNGYCGDAAISVIVGKGSPEAEKLVRVTEEALHEGIRMATVGNRLYDVSHAIQSHVESNGFSVVRDFVGHGIGRSVHESPQVPNYGSPGSGILLKDGLTIAIEPMVNCGNHKIKILKDGWTAVTSDGSLSAHFEHTIAVTNKGTFILTEPR
ncbi:MAG: type I methionyl aminopeptidase [Oligoflexia bacterium]|nr:type I methionyl aminopeptidase [Oligoflexia bacterium]